MSLRRRRKARKNLGVVFCKAEEGTCRGQGNKGKNESGAEAKDERGGGGGGKRKGETEGGGEEMSSREGEPCQPGSKRQMFCSWGARGRTPSGREEIIICPRS